MDAFRDLLARFPVWPLKPWLYTAEQCHDGALVYIVIALNMLSDLYLAIFFIPTVWSLQMDRSARATVTGFFGSRILYVSSRARLLHGMIVDTRPRVCGAAVAQLVLLPYGLGAHDQTCR